MNPQPAPVSPAADVTSIPLSKLRMDERNVRSGSAATADADTELVASIRSLGVLENLVVVPRGSTQYGVAAGSRRFRALKALAADGHIAKDHPVPCLVVDKTQAVASSLAENTVRVAMHPADQVVAFSRLAADGATTADIAERFGIAERTVQRRVRLGGLPREIIDAYRAGEINADTIEAFATTADTEFQREVFKSLSESRRLWGHSVRQALAEHQTKSNSPLARFVGLDEYRAAGGRTEDPLFEDDYTTLLDPALIPKLATEKLTALAEKITGWKWVKILLQMTHDDRNEYSQVGPDKRADFTKAERKRLDGAETAIGEASALIEEDSRHLDHQQIRELYDTIARNEKIYGDVERARAARDEYSDERRALAGVILTVNQDGNPSVIYGAVSKGDTEAMAALKGPATPGGTKRTIKATGASNPGEIETVEVVDEQPKPLSDSLRSDLRLVRAAAIRNAIATNVRVATDIAAFVLARMVRFGAPRLGYPPAVLAIREEYQPTPASDFLKTSPIMEHFAPKPADDTLAWLATEDAGDAFRQFQSLSDEQRGSVFAHAVAALAVPRLADDPEAPAHEAVVDALDLDLPAALRDIGAHPFSTELLWSRMTKAQICDAVSEVHATWPSQYGNLKKTELAAAADAALRPDPSRPADVNARVSAWLPQGLSHAMDDARKTRNGGTQAATSSDGEPPADSSAAAAAADGDNASGLPAFLTADSDA